MTKRVLLLTLMTAIPLAALSYLCFGRSDVEKLDELIRRNLPLASTKQQVYDFLDANRIRSSAYNAGPDPLVNLPEGQREWSRFVEARIPKRSLGRLLPDYTIHIVFYFDESYKVINYRLENAKRPADSF